LKETLVEQICVKNLMLVLVGMLKYIKSDSQKIFSLFQNQVNVFSLPSWNGFWNGFVSLWQTSGYYV